MNPSKFGLGPDTLSALKKLFATQPAIQKVILFGSRATGTFKIGSDIDLTLMAPKMNLSEFLHLQNQVEELGLPYKVDLSLFHQIDNPSLREHINRVGIEF
jgi:predicted nucleotidyltransferase